MDAKCALFAGTLRILEAACWCYGRSGWVRICKSTSEPGRVSALQVLVLREVEVVEDVNQQQRGVRGIRDIPVQILVRVCLHIP